MKKMKAAMIGFLPEEKDIYEQLELYAKMGYCAFEEASPLLREGDPAENLKRVKSFGMEPLALYFDVLNPPSITGLIKDAKVTGVKRVACFGGCAGEYRFGKRPNAPTLDELKRECEILDEAAEKLAKEGIVLTFHNHDAEFLQVLNGVPVFYQMAANTQYLKFEVDCGWVTYAGCDPIYVMKSLGGRMAAVHIKDFKTGSSVTGENSIVMPRFTTPGTGVLNLKGCLETALAAGIDYAIVEQDFQYHLSQEETLRAAYLNMKETGLVE